MQKFKWNSVTGWAIIVGSFLVAIILGLLSHIQINGCSTQAIFNWGEGCPEQGNPGIGKDCTNLDSIIIADCYNKETGGLGPCERTNPCYKYNLVCHLPSDKPLQSEFRSLYIGKCDVMPTLCPATFHYLTEYNKLKTFTC